MSIVERGDRLACVGHIGSMIRIYLSNGDGVKKQIGRDDSFFINLLFSEENVRVACQLIAESNGLCANSVGKGMGGATLFELV